MADVKVKTKSFKTVEELRGSVVRQQMRDQQAVVFVGPKAMAVIASKMPNDVVVGQGIWKDWPRIEAVRIDGGLRSFIRAADGDEIYFYELDNWLEAKWEWGWNLTPFFLFYYKKWCAFTNYVKYDKILPKYSNKAIYKNRRKLWNEQEKFHNSG